MRKTTDGAKKCDAIYITPFSQGDSGANPPRKVCVLLFRTAQSQRPTAYYSSRPSSAILDSLAFWDIWNVQYCEPSNQCFKTKFGMDGHSDTMF